MNPDQPVPPYKFWSQRRSDTSREWVEQLNRAFELLHEMPVPPVILGADDWAKHLRTTDPAAYWSEKLRETQGSGEPTVFDELTTITPEQWAYISANRDAVLAKFAPAVDEFSRRVEKFQGSGEPTIPSVPWEIGPIDELFLKTCGINPE